VSTRVPSTSNSTARGDSLMPLRYPSTAQSRFHPHECVACSDARIAFLREEHEPVRCLITVSGSRLSRAWLGSRVSVSTSAQAGVALERNSMYIGLGTIVLIVIIVLVIWMLRR
jgi:hypothetical protein